MDKRPQSTLLDLLELATGYGEAAAERLFTRPVRHETTSWEGLLAGLDGGSGEVEGILAEDGLWGIEEHTRAVRRRLEGGSVHPQWAADALLARACYLLTRLLKPHSVVETGVAYGVSTAFILAALWENGQGELHSIDLPRLRGGFRALEGVAVPPELKGRWVLHRGSSRRVLPVLLDELESVDLFLHDSLHTRRNMSREFNEVWPYLRPGGAVVADDVERNRAFTELRSSGPSLWRVVKDRERAPLFDGKAPVVFGVAIK